MESEVVVLYADNKPMKGITNPGPHQIYQNPVVSVEKRNLKNLNPEDIRVEMLYAGLCGTDIHLVETNPDTGYISCTAPTIITKEGRVIGHEGVGRIIEVGSRVKHLKPGAYVTFESILVCQYCDACRKGRFNQCSRAQLIGLEKDGLFGTVIDIFSMLAHDVTPLLDIDNGIKMAACVEPAGVAYVACQNVRIEAGDVVVVFGAGPIGVFSAMLSKIIFGASKVYIVEPIEFRRKFAGTWADGVFSMEEFFDYGPHSIDVVMEASGNMNNVNRIFKRLNANGRIAILGRSGKPLVLDAVDHMITNAISIIGSRGHLGGAFTNIFSLCKHKRIALHEVVTTVLRGTEELCNVLRSPKKITEENCKILVDLKTK